MSEDQGRYRASTAVQLEERIKVLEQGLAAMRDEERAREVKQLKYGIRVLGIIVLALGGWAWTQIEPLISLNVGSDR